MVHLCVLCFWYRINAATRISLCSIWRTIQTQNVYIAFYSVCKRMWQLIGSACESINFVECCLSLWHKFSFNKKYVVNLPHLALRTHLTLGNGNSNKIQVIRKDYSIGCKILGLIKLKVKCLFCFVKYFVTMRMKNYISFPPFSLLSSFLFLCRDKLPGNTILSMNNWLYVGSSQEGTHCLKSRLVPLLPKIKTCTFKFPVSYIVFVPLFLKMPSFPLLCRKVFFHI